MAWYFTIYDYNINKSNRVFPESTSCFADLFREVGVKTECIDINMYLFKNFKNDSWYHQYDFEKEDVIRCLDSFKDIINGYSVNEISAGEIENLERYTQVLKNTKGLHEYRVDMVSVNLKNATKAAIKFITTLVRYFYEFDTYSRFIDIMRNYLSLIDDPRFSKIPNIELLQIAHVNMKSGSSHGLFQATPGICFPIFPEKLFKERIIDPEYISLNSGVYSLFYSAGSDMRNKLDYIGFAEKYLKEKYEDNGTGA
jgi:hypothetical protein